MKGLGLLVTLLFAASVCLSAPVRSVLGAKQSGLTGTTDVWKNPYITDGLVAMWDGEWNVGPGKHDANATVWKDLISGTSMPLVGATVYSNYISFSKISSATPTRVGISALNVIFAESVWALDGPSQNYNAFISIRRNDSRCIGGMRRNDSNSLTWAIGRKTGIGAEYGIVHCTGGTLGAQNGFYYNGTWTAATAYSGWDASYTTKDYIRIWQNSSWASYGRIYNIRLYNRVLSADEVMHNYLVDKERFGL